MRMVMIVIMRVLVCMCHFGLLLGSLICLCHLSRGQVLAFQETSVSAAPHAMCYQRGYASLLLYEASVERVKPRAIPQPRPRPEARSKQPLESALTLSKNARIGRTQ